MLQLFDAITEVLQYIDVLYEIESNRCKSIHPDSYPDHLVKPITSLENSITDKPLSLLYAIINYQVFEIELIEILQDYPSVLNEMCQFKDEEGRTVKDILQYSSNSRSIQAMFPELFK